MKEVASSITILAAVLMLISAEHFNSLLFWVIGIVMLIDGTILFTFTTLFPKNFSNYLKTLKRKPAQRSSHE